MERREPVYSAPLFGRVGPAVRSLAAVCALWLGLVIVPGQLLQAATCGSVHVVKAGESLQQIGSRYYPAESMWTALYYANPDLLAGGFDSLEPGMELEIPCLSGLEDGGGEDNRLFRSKDEAELNLLTGGNYAPFTSRELPSEGLITEVVKAAFLEAPAPVTFSVSWEADWSRHLNPLLLDQEYDAGFPWLKPNCEDTPENFRCRNFHFSDPLVEMLIQLFVRADSDIEFSQDSDLHGRTLCRPKGYYTHDLDRPGRRWLSEGRVELVRGDGPADCFERLAAGEVDGVAVNEFLGRRTIHELGVEDEVRALDRPISVQGLHLIVPKTHPRATTFLYRFNAGVRELREAKRYERIVKRHMAAHWGRL